MLYHYSKLNPAVKDAIFRTAHNLAQVENVYNAAIRESLENIVQNDKIDVKALYKHLTPIYPF